MVKCIITFHYFQILANMCKWPIFINYQLLIFKYYTL